MSLFISWGVLGMLIGLHAAQRRGLSIAAAIIGGWLLGPLAFLMYFVTEKRPAPATDAVQCPYCAETIKAAAIICKHCGRNVRDFQPLALVRRDGRSTGTQGPSEW